MLLLLLLLLHANVVVVVVVVGFVFVFGVCSFLGRGPELPSLCTFRSSFWGQEGCYGQPF